MWDFILAAFPDYRSTYFAAYFVGCGIFFGIALREAWDWFKDVWIENNKLKAQQKDYATIWKYEADVADGNRARLMQGPVDGPSKEPASEEATAQEKIDSIWGDKEVIKSNTVPSSDTVVPIGRTAKPIAPSLNKKGKSSMEDDGIDKEKLLEKVRQFKRQQGDEKGTPSPPAIRTATAAMGGTTKVTTDKPAKRKPGRPRGSKKVTKKAATKKKTATRRNAVRVKTTTKRKAVKKKTAKKKAFSTAEKKVMARGKRNLKSARQNLDWAGL